MEKPSTVIDAFYPILLMDYIKQMTLANCILTQDENHQSTFKINKDVYERLMQYELKTPLIGISLEYDENSGILTAQADSKTNAAYNSKIMREVVLQYKESYANRYTNLIAEAAS